MADYHFVVKGIEGLRLAYTERNIRLIMERFQCDELTARDALVYHRDKYGRDHS